MAHALVNSDNLEKFIKNNIVPCVLKWGAKWCPPCRAAQPFIEKLAEKNPNINFVTIDVDKHRKIAREHNISSIPRFDFYTSNGTLLNSVSGYDSGAIEDTVKKM
tara:strand:- start:217 stop:531 length:315 start_codon:yes stop_codon:yes gene_type:complete